MDKVENSDYTLTTKIFIGMILGIAFGLLCHALPESHFLDVYVYESLNIVGQVFMLVIRMLVVPVVLVSLVCGTCSLKSGKQLGKLAVKTMTLYILTTATAIALALIIANLFQIGHGMNLTSASHFTLPKAVSFKDIILNIFPSNPFKALSEGNMLQIIFFALLLGGAISISGRSGRYIATFFSNFNEVLMNLITIVMSMAPYAIFCLIGVLFSKMGFSLILDLLAYFLTLLFVLAFHWFFIYGGLMRFVGGLNPFIFFKKMYSAMLFAFTISSSSASIPVVLETCEKKLGVKNSVASFIIPLGATINMDGTAIMQGVASVFIAHMYGVDINLTGYLTIVLMSTLASIGTAGVPGVGLITLAMVFAQVGLPLEGIGLIIGVDRLLDMTRTAVNITGDCAVACIVSKSEKEFCEDIYNNEEAS